MSYISAIILGLVQGVAEFLPISSSGHLSLFQHFFQLTDVEHDHMFFSVLLHLGTLVAVFFAYRRDIAELLREFFCMVHLRKLPQGQTPDIPARRMILMIIVATLPLLLVFPIKDRVELLYQNTFFIAFALVLTGTLLFVSDRMPRGHKTAGTATMGDAILVGLAQAVAVVPGLSRSGTTISAETAKSKALAHAGLSASQVTFVRATLDWDDGRSVYDVEFYTSDYKEYDYEIDANTGAVLSFDYDADHYTRPTQPSTGTDIGLEKAKSIALGQVSGASSSHIRQAKRDYDDGRLEYDVKIVYNNYEYEFEIDGTSGTILSRDVESIWD